MEHNPYVWRPYPCTGTANFETEARASLQGNMENNADEEQRLLAIEDWSAFSPGTLPGTLLMEGSLKASKLDASNTPFEGYVPTYNSTTGEFNWEDMSGVVGVDTYQVKWADGSGSAFLNDFVATDEEAAEGVSNELIITPAVMAAAVAAALPVGMVTPFPGDTAPEGWKVCDGSEISRDTYNKLFLYIGIKYGDGDGHTTFNIPNYLGKFLRCVDLGAGVDPDAATRENRGDGTVGDAVGTNQTEEFKSHAHVGATRTGSFETDNTGGHFAMRGNSGTGSAGGNETRPVNINVLYCIKV